VHLLCLDRDLVALDACRSRFQNGPYSDRVSYEHASFSELPAVLDSRSDLHEFFWLILVCRVISLTRQTVVFHFNEMVRIFSFFLIDLLTLGIIFFDRLLTIIVFKVH